MKSDTDLYLTLGCGAVTDLLSEQNSMLPCTRSQCKLKIPDVKVEHT